MPQFRWVPIGILLLSAGTVGRALPGSGLPATRPRPLIAGVTWDFEHLVRLAHGSDLWPVTWGADGDIYTGFGDGGGFEGDSDYRGRVSIGFARVGGMPPDVVGHNVWGDQQHGFAQHQATFGGKPISMISVDGVLYAFVTSWANLPGKPNPVPPQSRLAWSTDSGASWKLSDWKLVQSPGNFYGCTFLNFGRDYQGARDSFIYIYGGITGRQGVVLARASKEGIRDIETYEFFSGMDNDHSPKWTRRSGDAQAVFVDPQRPPSEVLFSVVYDAPLKRYLATWSHDGTIGSLWMLDAPQPWGPWTAFATYDNWGHFGRREGLLWSIPTKWISQDGLSFWCVFSAGRLRPTDRLLDSFNLVRASLQLKHPR